MRSPSSVHSPLLLRLATVLFAAALVAPAAAPAAETDPIPAAQTAGDRFAARLQELREAILANPGSPAIAADLYAYDSLLRFGGNLERGADTFRRVARSGSAAPEVRALAWRMLAEVERLRGRAPRMEESLDAIGVLRDFAIVGPFDDENGGGYDVAYGPELDLDLSRTHEGSRGEVAWRVVEGLGRTGTVAIHEAVRPTREVVVYALTTLDVPAATSATLYLGTPGATKAWLNGRPVLADPDRHPARFDQKAVRLDLQRGSNVLLLKLTGGTSGPFELHARVVGANGRPIRGLRAKAPTSGRFARPAPIAAGRVIRGVRPLVDVLERAAKGNDPAALYAWARVLAERHPYDESEKRAEAAAARAANADPRNLEAQFLAARTADDINESRAFLEQAAAHARPGDARAHTALANFWMGRGDSFRALQILQPAAENAPGDWPAQLVVADALDAQGFQARALAVVESLAQRHPDEPRILQALARHRLRDRRSDDAARILRVALAHRPGSVEIATTLASILVDRGQAKEAALVLANAARLAGADLSLLLRRADLLAANGAEAEAKKLYDAAIAMNPQAGEVFERAGQSALRAGDRVGALALFQRSLEVQPQNAWLKELVQQLQPGAASFASAFLHDLREVAARAKAHEGEDAVKLVDLAATHVLPSGQASRTRQTIVRVQSQRGVDRFRTTPIRYAPDREQLKVVRARVLKADGTIVDAHEESERSVNEAWSGMYFDTRTRYVSFPGLAPGDVVELVWRSDDVAGDNLLGDYFGDVDFVQDTVPTERWEYVLEMPPGRPIFANRLPLATYEETRREGGRVLHRWSATDVPRVLPEPGMPGWTEVAAYLHVSTYRDWESVARFWWGLVKDQVRPTPEIERVAKEIVAGIPASDVDGRVRAVYNYVVKNTRYVGLEFGIHGFKPYKVEQVLRRRFGDCKDKASLTYALLRSIGIDSKLVLLRMRHLGAIGAEPASLAVFNHAILYVPQLDLWLDGTAEWSGSQELPESDRGAEVLVVDPEGTSRFGRIPEAPASLSVNDARHLVQLGADGSATVAGESTIRGIPAPGYRRAYASPNGRTASFEQAWARTFPGVTVTRLEMNDLTRLEEDVRLDFGLRVPRYAERVGEGRLAFRPFGDARSWVESYAPLSSRQQPLVLRHAFENRFEYTYELPEGFRVERLPRTGEVRSDFGFATLAIEEAEGRVIARGTVSIAVPRIEAADYPAFRRFLAEVDELFGGKLVVGRGG